MMHRTSVDEILQFHSGSITATINRRLFLRNIALVAAASQLTWLAACRQSPTLTVAVHPWVGYETLYLARDLNWLPKQILLRDDSTLGESLQALQTGKAEAICLTLDEMLRARAAGVPLGAALVFDVSAGADKVLARPEITTLADLAGKRIGFDPNALGALVFGTLLEATGLPASAFIRVDLPPARQLEAWHKKEVDAVVTYEPMATEFERAGARNLFDSRQIPDTIIDVLAVRRDRPEVLPLVRELVVSHFRALQHMRTNQQDSLYRIAAREELTPEETRVMLAGVTLPSLAANHAYLLGADARLLSAARRISALMVRLGMLAREDSLEQLIIPDTLPGNEG